MTSTLRYAYRGLVVPVFTPFKSNSEKATNAYLIPRYSDYLKSKNIPGVLVNGTTGEGMTMSVNERKEIAEAWSEAAERNNQHLVLQVGGAPLADVKDLASHARTLNVSAILCLPELYYKPRNVEELADYLTEVSGAAPETPLLYYHYPDMSRVSIHMTKFLETAAYKIPTLVGIKFTSHNLAEATQILKVEDGRFVLFLGSNEIILPGSSVGIDSFMPSITNLFPELVQAVIKFSKEGDYSSAKTKQEKLLRAFHRLSQLGHPAAGMKAAMSHLTPLELGPSRKPLPSLENEHDQRKLRNLLNGLN